MYLISTDVQTEVSNYIIIGGVRVVRQGSIPLRSLSGCPSFTVTQKSGLKSSPICAHSNTLLSGHHRALKDLNMATSGDLTQEVLQALSKESPILSQEVFPQATFAELKAALDRLASRSMVIYEQIEKEEPVLEPEAEQIVAHGSHEARVFEALRQAVEGLTVQDLEKTIGDKNVTKMGQGKAFREKWIAKTSDGKLKASVSYTWDDGSKQN